MKSVVVVGSGASGVHFALSVLRKGYHVTMVDVGREPRSAAPLEPDADFSTLKERLADPARYFLGESFEGVVLPDVEKEYYGIPPHKQYVFDVPQDFRYATQGFAPLFSFARGGLAEAWTAGCYPFNDAELSDFLFGYQAIGPCYDEVARRIGITGEADDLSRFMPVHDHLLPPLRLDPHSDVLLAAYAARRTRLNERLGCYVGRTRVATLSVPRDGRGACDYEGRCLWGCPREALYTPSLTLRECHRYPNFSYVTGTAEIFTLHGTSRITGLVVTSRDGASQSLPVDRLVLAAGTLSSARIVLRSVHAATGEVARLSGLMDNRQLLVPFFNIRMLTRGTTARNYQYHLLGLGFEADDPREYVHGQITTLTTALLHPIVQRLPLNLRAAMTVTRHMRAGLGVVNVNLHDRRRVESYVTLEPGAEGNATLVMHYTPAADEPATIARVVRRVKAALWQLGCIVPPGMLHVRPMGASVHYAGTFPMTASAQRWTTDQHCRSRDFENLYLVDGSTFPFLPAKNLTFTLMANAVRVAEAAF